MRPSSSPRVSCPRQTQDMRARSTRPPRFKKVFAHPSLFVKSEQSLWLRSACNTALPTSVLWGGGREMGVDGLPPYLKGVGSLAVYLGRRRADEKVAVIIDGGYLLHKMCVRGEAAYELVFEGDVTALVRQCVREVKRLESRGIEVIVVFDGAAPPAKGSTGDDRREKREIAERKARELDKKAGSRLKVSKLAAGACSFDPRTTARVARRLRREIVGLVYIAPREADPQLVVFQDIRLAEGADVMVYGSDSDLIVLGVSKLLYEIKEKGGVLTGRCIVAKLILEPQSAFKEDTKAHAFLRQLHGLPKAHDKDLDASPLELHSARQRLILFSAVTGSDFAKFPNIGPAAAAKTALTPVESSTSPRQADAIADVLGGVAERVVQHSKEGEHSAVLRQLSTALNMFIHPVVWSPLRDRHEHLSGVDSSEEITNATGQSRITFLSCLQLARQGWSSPQPLYMYGNLVSAALSSSCCCCLCVVVVVVTAVSGHLCPSTQIEGKVYPHVV